MQLSSGMPLGQSPVTKKRRSQKSLEWPPLSHPRALNFELPLCSAFFQAPGEDRASLGERHSMLGHLQCSRNSGKQEVTEVTVETQLTPPWAATWPE